MSINSIAMNELFIFLSSIEGSDLEKRLRAIEVLKYQVKRTTSSSEL